MATAEEERQRRAGNDARGARLFRGLDPAARADVEAAGRVVHARRGERLFRQGAAARAFFILRDGGVKLTSLNPDGQVSLIRIVIPGEAFGGVAAFGNRTYPVSAEAADDVVALAWDGRTIDRLLRRHPQLAINLIDLLAERLHDMQARYEELANEQVERRLARTLLRLVRRTGRRVDGGVLVDVRLTRQELAEMTGTSLFTVSRILKRWQGAGMIASRRQRLLVQQPHALVHIAEDLGAPAGDGGEVGAREGD